MSLVTSALSIFLVEGPHSPTDVAPSRRSIIVPTLLTMFHLPRSFELCLLLVESLKPRVLDLPSAQYSASYKKRTPMRVKKQVGVSLNSEVMENAERQGGVGEF
jgi:hypothetical protein